MRRYRARLAGQEVPSPATDAQRRKVAADLAHRADMARAERRDVQTEELAAAHRETARMARELAEARIAIKTARRTAATEQQDRAAVEKDTRFIAAVFARTLTRAGLAEQVSAPVRDRVTPWLPEGESPWA